MGWDHYDSETALEARNDLYRKELRWMLNLYLPSVKLVKKIRVGSKLRRVYDRPQTPLERVTHSGQADASRLAELTKLKNRRDPFELARIIDRKLKHIYGLENHRLSPGSCPVAIDRRKWLRPDNGCGKAARGGGSRVTYQSKNKKLHEGIARGFAESGGTTIPLDHVRLDRLFAMIARGLAWHHWQVLLGAGYTAIASTFVDSGMDWVDQAFTKTPIRVGRNLGEDTFSYQGAQAVDGAETTFWRFSMYGGVFFAGPKVPGPASLAVAVTGRDAFIEKLQNTAA